MARLQQGETKQPANSRPSRSLSSARWQSILHLGEQLQSLAASFTTYSLPSPTGATPERTIILAQRDLVISTTETLLGGKAEFWLSPWLRFETACPRSDSPTADLFFPTDPPNSLIQAAAQARQSQPSRGVKSRSHKSRRPIDALAIPLLLSDEHEPLLGVLYFERPNGPPLHKAEIDQLEGIASQAALALQVTCQAARFRRRTEQLTLVRQVSNAIASVLDPDELLEQVVSLIHERFSYPFVHLFSVHPGRRKIFYEAGSGARSQQIEKQSFAEKQVFAYDLDDPHGIIPWVAQHGQKLLSNDICNEPRFRRFPLSAPVSTAAELAVPLKFGDQVLGVLDIQSDQVDAFDSEDVYLIEALADHIAVSMRNASLYRSEKWRRQVADSLHTVAGLLSADVDLEQVLQAILAELERNLPCDLAAIWLVEGSLPGDQGSPLRLAGVHGSRAAFLQLQIGMNLDELLSEHATLPEWLFRATQEADPVIRRVFAPMDALGQFLEFPADYSAIAAPLRITRASPIADGAEPSTNLQGAEFLGLLTLFHHTGGRYGGETQAITAAFASYASVAIENTRLFEAAHEQVWVSTVLLQVASATQSITDLDELLATIAQLTPMLAGVNASAIYLLDENGVFSPAAAAGLDPAAQSEFKNTYFLDVEIPSMAQLLVEKRPVILHRHGEESRLARMITRSNQLETALEFLVLVPLLSQNEVLGAMLVDCVNDPMKSNVQALETFFDERLPILQGIAHQAAAAIQNQRLVKAQTEEAYTSVAMLQVAQAIVSSGDITETLSAIARITPILVGVKRVAIYLLDSPGGVLRLVGSYGLPRDADLYRYSPDEFPLLEAVLQRDALAACILETDLEPEEDEWEDVPDAWTCLPVPSPEQIDETLASHARLLLGFPLSIKGTVMGIMIAEEPDLHPSGGRQSTGSNLRLRSRRLEITTGISQQTALAIQNEILQREMLDRQRLEREMQLARQIQRTFLPHTIPELPGWELDVWWRMAREVGGDFYDLIELPEGRLGLLIADVADKGMPAALFMTLIRTLVRAVVRELTSPAAVLARVNDLLVPDAQEGMFVTLFYAVLEPTLACLTYANAGHNPPIWVHFAHNQIEQLTKTGMALGVLEGIPVEERTINVKEGDFIVLYTDGVTDAFSPQEESYGAERLTEAIRQAAFSSQPAASALEMLQAIDDSIATFIQDALPTDDSTVLVLHCMR